MAEVMSVSSTPDFESALRLWFWTQIKNHWWEESSTAQLFLDDKDNVLAINIDNTVAVLCYLHIPTLIHNQDDFQDIIDSAMVEVVTILRDLTIVNKWDRSKLLIVTTYSLSAYENLNFLFMEDDINYLYLMESPGTGCTDFTPKVDQKIAGYQAEGKEIADYIVHRVSKDSMRLS